MGIDFKEDVRIDKMKLIFVARILIDVLADINNLNIRLSEFNTSNNNVFDDTLDIGTRYIDEALDLVKNKLGSLELDEKLAQKK